jgi:hypothetical protein
LDAFSCTDVSEYVSRWARWRLTIACVDSLRERVRDKEGNVKGGVIGAFAIRVGVSRRTVQRWLAYDIQSCNVNAERIVELTLELSPVEARMILEEDLSRHREAVESILDEMCQGAVASSVEVSSG